MIGFRTERRRFRGAYNYSDLEISGPCAAGVLLHNVTGNMSPTQEPALGSLFFNRSGSGGWGEEQAVASIASSVSVCADRERR